MMEDVVVKEDASAMYVYATILIQENSANTKV